MEIHDRAGPVIMVVAATIMWGVMGLFTRPLLSMGVDPMSITLTRYVVTLVPFFVMFLVMDKSYFKIELKDLWIFIGGGILGTLPSNALYCAAQNEISLSLSAVLLYTSPFFVLILSAVFFKERVNTRKIVSLLLAFAGCVLCTGLLTDPGSANIGGILLALGSGMGLALYNVFSKFALRKYRSFTVIFYCFLIASLCIIPLCDLGTLTGALSATSDAWLYVILLGLVSTLLPYLAYNYGLRRMETSKTSILAYGEVFTMTVVGIVVFSEPLSVFSATGLILMLVALIILNLRYRDRLDVY